MSYLSIQNIETKIKKFLYFSFGMNLSLFRFVPFFANANKLRRVDFHTHKISFLQTKTTSGGMFHIHIIYVCFDSNGRSDEIFVKLYHRKVIQKGDCRVFSTPNRESENIHFSVHFKILQSVRARNRPIPQLFVPFLVESNSHQYESKERLPGL